MLAGRLFEELSFVLVVNNSAELLLLLFARLFARSFVGLRAGVTVGRDADAAALVFRGGVFTATVFTGGFVTG